MRLPLLVVAGLLALALAAGDPGLGGPGLGGSGLGGPGLGGSVLRVVTAAGEVLLRAPLGADPTWEVVWLHSVARVWVRDAFAWRDGTMLLTDQRTPYFDIAGLGHTPGRGELRDDGAGGFWIAGIDERLDGDVHRFVIGSAHAPTTLRVAGRTYDLSASHPGVRARIEVIAP